jgi:hypothetical protein
LFGSGGTSVPGQGRRGVFKGLHPLSTDLVYVFFLYIETRRKGEQEKIERLIEEKKKGTGT